MAGWHHQCKGHEPGQTSGDGEDREAWRAAVHGVAKSQTRLSGLTATAVCCSSCKELRVIISFNPHESPGGHCCSCFVGKEIEAQRC